MNLNFYGKPIKPIPPPPERWEPWELAIMAAIDTGEKLARTLLRDGTWSPPHAMGEDPDER